MDPVEIIILSTGLLYVLLAARNRPSCWIWGIICSALIAYQSFYVYTLYLDSALQIFYIVMGGIGLWQWLRQTEDHEIALEPRFISMRSWISIGLIGVTLTGVSGYLLGTYSDAFASYWDAATTVYSVIATILLVRRYIDNWLLWIPINIVMVILYFWRGGYGTGILYAVYAMMAVYGWIHWKSLAYRPKNTI